MSESISDKALEKATGAVWQTWFERLESINARNLTHKDIATRLVSDFDVPGWWAQSLAVRYEKAIGRRATGQNIDGSFSTSVSKTIDGSMDGVLQWWLQKVDDQTEFNNVAVVTSSVTQTEKWRNYRVALADGSRVIVGIYAKTPTKAGFSLQHEKLGSAEAAAAWRSYWKTLLASE